jgi:Lrp/AsnC family leucine-responsive transcriptional regulator
MKKSVDLESEAGQIAIPAPSAPSNRRLDAIDLRLLDALRANARMSQEELSRVLNLSRPAVRDRMRRLEMSGVIAGYTIIVDWESVGFPILAFIQIRTIEGSCEVSAREVAQLANADALVEECHPITGDWCLLARVRARSSNHLSILLSAIRSHPNISATSTTLALR